MRNAEYLRFLPDGSSHIRTTKHGDLYLLPCHHTIMVPGSPGDRRGVLNFKADLRRLGYEVRR